MRTIVSIATAALFAISCTPARGGGRHTLRERGAADASTDASTDAAEPDGSIANPADMPKAFSACAVDGARACTGPNGRGVLLCRASMWQPQTDCKDNERCQTSLDDRQGPCRAITADCQGHSPREVFCSGDIMQICEGDSAAELPCGEQRRCITENGQAICACVPGSIDMGSGCRAATNCDAAQGGCDLMTDCKMLGSQRTCTDCPMGYDGTGLSGCVPRLLALRPACGAVVSEPSGSASEYRLQLPYPCQELRLAVTAPANAKLEIEGVAVAAESPWVSKPLAVGETKISVNLIAKSGRSREYSVIANRRGAEHSYVKASNARPGDQFGFNVALDGDSFIGGAPWEDSASGGVDGNQMDGAAADSGAAYVFAHSGEAWVQQAYLKADVPAAGDFFGTSVAISGDLAVVGAPRFEATWLTLRTPMLPGSAYVYRRQNGKWALDGKLAPSVSANGDLFGFKVWAHDDTVFVSAANDGDAAPQSGAIYVFKPGASGWTLQQKLKADPPIANSMFGFSIAVDGDTLLAGAAQDPTGGARTGSAYVFVARAGSWQQQAHLVAATPVAGATLGWAVALQGDTAVVGAPAVNLRGLLGVAGKVHVFERAQDRWTMSAALAAPSSTADDYFGTGVGLSGSTILVGGNNANLGAGSAFLLARDGAAWVHTAMLEPGALEAGDGFGLCAAMNDHAIVLGTPFEDNALTGVATDPTSNGAMNSGVIHVFR